MPGYRLLSPLLGLALLTACQVNLATPRTNTPAERTARSPAPSLAPSASPSVAPASPSPSANLAVAPSASPSVPVNPFGLPTAIRPPLPASVISTGGGNLIGQAGGNLIGQAGGNYGVLQATEGQRLAGGYFSAFLGNYLIATTVVQAILASPHFRSLVPGVPRTGDPGIPILAGQNVTGLLEVRADHALLSIGLGDAAKGPNQLVAIRFTSPTKGKAVFHGVMFPEKPFLALEYDLEAGTGSGDGASVGVASGRKVALHWEFRKVQSPAGGPVFRIQASRTIGTKPGDIDGTQAGLVANYLADERGAFTLGLLDKNGTDLLFLSDLGAFLPGAPQGFYYSADGQLSATADATLQAVLPTAAEIHRPFPTVWGDEEDYKQLPHFAFPE